MKRVLLISVLSVLMSFCSINSLNAKIEEVPTLTLVVSFEGNIKPNYFRLMGGAGIVTETFLNANVKQIVIPDYLYIGGIFLNFELNYNSSSSVSVTITDYELNYSTSFEGSNNSYSGQVFVPVPSKRSETIHITVRPRR